VEIIQGISEENRTHVLNQLMVLEQKIWDKSMAASIEQVRNRLTIFSDGLWRLYDEGNLKAYMFFYPISKVKAKTYNTWEDFTSEGYCSNFDPLGKILFGTTICSDGKRYGSLLFASGVSYMKNQMYENVEEVWACSRIPSLALKNIFEKDITIDEKELYTDGVVKMLLNQGFKPFSLNKDGYKIDKESLGYSLTMVLKV
jgi:hypothetical protein